MPNSNFKTEKVYTTNKYGEKLAGLRDFPADQENTRLPTVILAHGFSVDKSEHGMFDQVAERLVSDGFQIFRFDFSGLGESEGDYSLTSLTKLKEDLSSIVEFVKAQPTTNTSLLGMLGMSLGTATIAALHQQDIKAFVYLGSVSEPFKSLKDLFGKGYDPDGISVRINSAGRRVEVQSQFWKDFKNYDLPALIKDTPGAKLFIHGDKDSLVGVESAQLFYDNSLEPKEIKIIKNADHGFEEPEERQEMIDLTADWFNKYLK